MSHTTPCTSARCEIVIFVWAMARARSGARSIVHPPRKWRMFTPRSNPSRLTRMKSAAGPWNQVAIMNPSSCHTVANRSQSPASRHSAQFSTSSRISRRSSTVSPRPSTLTSELRRYRNLTRRRDRRPSGNPAHVRRAVRVERLNRLDPPGLTARAFGLRPDDGLVGGIEDEMRPGRDLDPVSARLIHVQEHALRNSMLGGCRLDRDVRIQEQVRGAQHLLAGVDEERQVVQPASGAGVVGDVDELVRGDRQAHPCPDLAAVVGHDLLVKTESEDVLGEAPVDGDITREHVDMVEALDRGAAADIALGYVLERRPQMLGRLVALGLVVELEAMPVGIGERERWPVADVAVDPLAALSALLHRGDAALERPWAPGAEREMAEPREGCLGQLQAVALVVTPPAQKHGLSLTRLDLHPEQLDKEAQALVRERREQLRVPDVREVVDRFRFGVVHRVTHPLTRAACAARRARRTAHPPVGEHA